MNFQEPPSLESSAFEHVTTINLHVSITNLLQRFMSLMKVR